jgi:hypothetical protein
MLDSADTGSADALWRDTASNERGSFEWGLSYFHSGIAGADVPNPASHLRFPAVALAAVQDGSGESEIPAVRRAQQPALAVRANSAAEELSMAQHPNGWYDDPTNQYMYRYWNGTHWTDQVSSGGATSTDANAMDSSAAAVPPGPGSEAPSAPSGAGQPTVQVTQKSGSAIGTIIGVLVALVAVVVLIVVLVNNSGGDSSTPVEAPATTEAPAVTVAP